tara:strand:+ start:2209 stop:3192 length:984 start_codon:yes stop_codon:yes gene_type:complete
LTEEILTNYLLVIFGLAALFVGGNYLVKGSVSLARKIKVSKLVIAVTIVAFGTSLPELLVSLEAALSGSPSLAIGNVVGSNIANVLLVLGIPAVIFAISTDGKGIKRDSIILLFTYILMIFFFTNGRIEKWEGFFLFSLLIVFLLFTYFHSKKNRASLKNLEYEINDFEIISSYKIISISILGGFCALFIGSKLLIKGASSIAFNMGIPEEIIGLTLVAFGTSLPELVTSLVAAFKKQGELVLGNIIGSNIFNTLGVLGITAFFVEINISQKMFSFDVILMIIAIIFLFPFIYLKKTIGKLIGIVLFLTYLFYVWAQFIGISGIAIQ